MLNQTRFTAAMFMTTLAVSLASCGTKSVEGTYNITNAPVPGIVATLGKKKLLVLIRRVGKLRGQR